jgi:hypothetical protein
MIFPSWKRLGGKSLGYRSYCSNKNRYIILINWGMTINPDKRGVTCAVREDRKSNSGEGVRSVMLWVQSVLPVSSEKLGTTYLA